MVEAGGLVDLADGEREAVRHGREVGDDDHLACLEAIGTPPTWRPTVDEIWSAVYLGVCTM